MKDLKPILRDLFFGAFYYALYQQVIHTSSKYRDVVYVLLLGEFIGFPMIGNYYTLRLLPYLYADLESVAKRVLREYDVLELLHEGAPAH